MAGWDERIAQLEAEFPGWHIWRRTRADGGPPGPAPSRAARILAPGAS